MVSRLLLILLCSFPLTSLIGQTASTICLNEVKAAYASIDHEKLLQAPGQSNLQYTREYAVRANPQEFFKSSESRTYSPGQLNYKHYEGLTVTDEEEAFILREGQYVIYRTGSQLKKEAPVVNGLDAGIFEHCTALNCKFTADRSNKSAYLVVDAAGQKKYQISDLTIETNPLDSSLVRIQVNYLAPHLYQEADYHFEKISMDPQAKEQMGKAASVFLKEDGSLKDQFKGNKLMDYRR